MARALLILLIIAALASAVAQTLEIDQRLEPALASVFSLAWDRLRGEVQGDADLAARAASYQVKVTASGLIMTDVPFDARAWHAAYGEQHARLPVGHIIPLHEFTDAALLAYFLRFYALAFARDVSTELFLRVGDFRPGVTVINFDRRELLILLVDHTRVGLVQFAGPVYLMTAEDTYVVGEIYQGRSHYLRLGALRSPGGQLTSAGRAYLFFGLEP